MKKEKNFKIVSLKILKTLYNFEPKSEKHNDFTISDLKMMLFLTDYRDNYGKTEVRYSFIRNNSGIRKNNLLYSTLKKFGIYKNPENHLYAIQLNSDWRIDTTLQYEREFRLYNTINDRHNANRYAKLPLNVYNILLKSNDINFWKLTFFILYKTYSDPHINFSFDLNVLYNRLMIPSPKCQNKKYYKEKMKAYLNTLCNIKFITQGDVIDNNFIFYKNTKYNENINETKALKQPTSYAAVPIKTQDSTSSQSIQSKDKDTLNDSSTNTVSDAVIERLTSLLSNNKNKDSIKIREEYKIFANENFEDFNIDNNLDDFDKSFGDGLFSKY